jgi:hypothetical protein
VAVEQDGDRVRVMAVLRLPLKCGEDVLSDRLVSGTPQWVDTGDFVRVM